MCDLFWVSPGNQGDLSDVVRASLHHHQPAEEEHDSPPLLEGGRGGGMVVVSHGDEQLVGMMGGDTRPSSDHHALLHHPPSTTAFPQPQGLMIRERPPPQLGPPGGATDVQREGGVVAPPEIILGDHLPLMPMVDPRTHHLPAIKRSCRKSQTRKVVCIPAPTAASGRPSTSGGEVVPSDLWAWRKYGQKPIKGSPYPRGYYRCSSSKGCPARKQVERSRTDPTMLVITYTCDHNHPWPTQRNALAGSTRPSSSSSAAAKNTSSTSTFTAAGPGAYGNSNGGGATASAAHHQLKQEVLDTDDLDLFADMDALNIFSSSSATSKINNEDDTKEQLLDPFSSSLLDYWVSFGEADI